MTEITAESETVWVFPEENPEWAQTIEREFNLHPVTAQILVSRGFKTLEDVHHHFYAQLPDLHDPALLGDMDKAVKRIIEACSRDEGILIYGDNDVDGISGVTLLYDFLSGIGARAYYYVSSRNLQRDSLIVEALEFAIEHDCKLFVTVDCGITAASEIERIVSKDIDVIVTDHHEPTHSIPHCVATLNPKLLDSDYPNRELTGVGVAFKLAHAMTSELVSKGLVQAEDINLKRYLDLVALGTISDMGALHGENRILVRYGLKQLAETDRVGLAKLMAVSDVDTNNLTTTEVASKLAPRLNSLGRIADPRKGVQLLLLSDPEKAEALAIELDINNLERQKIERTMSGEAELILQQKPELLQNKAIVLHSEGWHPGVIAIVATRYSKTYNRPVAVIAVEDGVGKGSLRSIRQFPLLKALKNLSHLLINYGGHDFAAGLTIPTENIPAFREGFLKMANEGLEEADVAPKLYLDAKADFTNLTFDFLETLKLLEPFGNENPPPVLWAEATQAWPPKVVGKAHLKLYLEQSDRMLEGIAFGMGHRVKGLKRKNLKLRCAFTPQVNTFQNKASIQLMVRDFVVL